MPQVTAFHLCLVSATAALVYQSPRLRGAALAACLLMAGSALSTFGAVYQLIAQVGGLAMLAACATALMRPFEEPGPPGAKPTRWLLARRGVLVGLLGGG